MYSLNCNGRLFRMDGPKVMGIINTTPDSFYEGSRLNQLDEILRRAEQMIADGASILDIGGQSTRPGSEQIKAEEELKRVLPAIEAINRRFPQQMISIDSYYSKVVKAAVEAGAGIVNDVSAGSIDEKLIPTVAALKVPYVLMHMKGHPQNMQKNPEYKNVTEEVFDFLNFRSGQLKDAGIEDLIIDPGFGFGKTIEHNFSLLNQLDYFHHLDKPIMVGLSRKSTVYRTLKTTPEQALNGTTVLNTIALLKGADILRVHDVKEAVEAIKLVNALNKKEQL
jgi:dihydropteroate synthase